MDNEFEVVLSSVFVPPTVLALFATQSTRKMRKTRAMVLFLCFSTFRLAFAFVGPHKASLSMPSSLTRISARTQRTFATRNMKLQFSDVPNNQDKEDDAQRESFFRPPPFPEDLITLSGDLFSLIVYGFSDHLIGCDIAQYMVHQADSVPKLLGLMDTSNPSVPVWLDVSDNFATQTILHAQVADQYIVRYASPILEYTGSAVIFLSSFWLLAGWLTRAFEYQHTLQCRSDHALVRMALSWGLCMTLMLSTLVLVTPEPLKNSDVLFLADSLTVLAIWRFMINRIFGGSESD